MSALSPPPPPLVTLPPTVRRGEAAEQHARHGPGDLWVFAYGSLMWRPGFPVAEARPARLHGWHRALCIRSIRYRGTPEAPGLVLGLDRGGACVGRALRVAAAARAATVAYLEDRELITRVYEARFLPLRLDDGRRVEAYGFVARRDHPQYAGGLDEAAQAAIVARCAGQEGPCRDYLANTVRHLDDLGVRDGLLHRVLARVEGLVSPPGAEFALPSAER